MSSSTHQRFAGVRAELLAPADRREPGQPARPGRPGGVADGPQHVDGAEHGDREARSPPGRCWSAGRSRRRSRRRRCRRRPRPAPNANEPSAGSPAAIRPSPVSTASTRLVPIATISAAVSGARRPTTVAPTSSSRPASSSARVCRTTSRIDEQRHEDRAEAAQLDQGRARRARSGRRPARRARPAAWASLNVLEAPAPARPRPGRARRSPPAELAAEQDERDQPDRQHDPVAPQRQPDQRPRTGVGGHVASPRAGRRSSAWRRSGAGRAPPASAAG